MDGPLVQCHLRINHSCAYSISSAVAAYQAITILSHCEAFPSPYLCTFISTLWVNVMGNLKKEIFGLGASDQIVVSQL